MKQLVLCADRGLGLRAVIAIDDTTLRPGLGGVRFKPYPALGDAIRECRRLAVVMTLKNAVAELPYGGAKSVLIDPGPAADRDALLRRFGEFVVRLGGAYLPAVDMGTSPDDMAVIAKANADVSCADEDPSAWTALGVFAAIEAAAARLSPSRRLADCSVVVQGVGHVGAALVGLLANAGARVLVADIDSDRAEDIARSVDGVAIAAEQAIAEPCDIFAPCAVARVVTATTVTRLCCRAIVGAANDVLGQRELADTLLHQGVVYVPDFVANAGGVINIHARRAGWDTDQLRREVLAIGDRVRSLLDQAEASAITPLAAAERLAHERLGATRNRQTAVSA